MTKRPEVGDTVIIRGTVCDIDAHYFSMYTSSGQDSKTLMYVSYAREFEVIPKPWEPKVGDRIRYNSGSTFVYTIRAIVQDKVWVNWLTYCGTCHDSIIYDFKKEDYTLCVD